jgi:hypothetical protein
VDLLDDQDAWSQLLRPHAASRWFEDAPAGPPGSGPQLAEAWWLAELSRLSYRDRDRDGPLGAAGLREFAFVQAGGTQCLIAVPSGPEPEVALVAFRGSDELRDWQSNFQVVPAAWPEGGQVHRGFKEAFERAWGAIEAALEACALPFLVGGHSLGGALAQLAASRRRPRACCAFGAPRVGDEGFAASLDGREVRLFVHGADRVPDLPPSSPLLRFAAAGTCIQLPAVVDRPRRSDPPAFLADHAALRYVVGLGRALVAPDRDPGYRRPPR